MKTCKKCGEQKPLEGFYKHPKMADGHLGKCKECCKAAERVRQVEKADEIRAYEKSRANQPHRVAARLAYQQTEQGREAGNRAKRRWIELHPKQHAAHVAVGNAIRDGKLIPTPCMVCGAEHVEGRHPDYDAPLDVVWLCVPCHEGAHSLVRESASHAVP